MCEAPRTVRGKRIKIDKLDFIGPGPENKRFHDMPVEQSTELVSTVGPTKVEGGMLLRIGLSDSLKEARIKAEGPSSVKGGIRRLNEYEVGQAEEIATKIF